VRWADSSSALFGRVASYPHRDTMPGSTIEATAVAGNANSPLHGEIRLGKWAVREMGISRGLRVVSSSEEGAGGPLKISAASPGGLDPPVPRNNWTLLLGLGLR
jgi:hypothetical protein